MRVFSITAAGLVIFVALSVGIASGDPPTSSSSAEETRLQREINRVYGELSACRKRLRASERRVDELASDNDALRRAAKRASAKRIEPDASKLLVSFLASMESFLIHHFDMGQDFIDAYYVVMYRGLLSWQGKDINRQAFCADAIAWLAPRARRVQAQAKPHASHVNCETLDRPAAVEGALDGLPKGEAAKVIGNLLGRDVVWTGVVTEEVEKASNERDFVLDCGGVTVNVDVLERHSIGLRQIHVGVTVEVRGKISRVDNYGWMGVRVHLKECSVRPG